MIKSKKSLSKISSSLFSPSKFNSSSKLNSSSKSNKFSKFIFLSSVPIPKLLLELIKLLEELIFSGILLSVCKTNLKLLSSFVFIVTTTSFIFVLIIGFMSNSNTKQLNNYYLVN